MNVVLDQKLVYILLFNKGVFRRERMLELLRIRATHFQYYYYYYYYYYYLYVCSFTPCLA